MRRHAKSRTSPTWRRGGLRIRSELAEVQAKLRRTRRSDYCLQPLVCVDEGDRSSVSEHGWAQKYSEPPQQPGAVTHMPLSHSESAAQAIPVQIGATQTMPRLFVCAHWQILAEPQVGSKSSLQLAPLVHSPLTAPASWAERREVAAIMGATYASFTPVFTIVRRVVVEDRWSVDRIAAMK